MDTDCSFRKVPLNITFILELIISDKKGNEVQETSIHTIAIVGMSFIVKFTFFLPMLNEQ